MKREEDAFALAKEMVSLGKNAGRNTIAVISDMDQPLGRAIGNAMEVREAIETLNGKGPEDFTKLCMTLGTMMLLAGGVCQTQEEAEQKLQEVIQNGSALQKLAQLVKAQGGDESAVFHPEKLPKASIVETICADKDGYVQKIVCDEAGVASLLLGGGRETKESRIDLSVGILLHKKVGDAVKKGEVLAELHANDAAKLALAKERLLAAYHIGTEKREEGPVIIGILK